MPRIVDKLVVTTPDPVVQPRSPATGDTTVRRAPDGMVIAGAPAPPRSLDRLALIAAAKTADVPQRKQQGPTCGLYALGMVMDFWHAKDPTNVTAWVSEHDLLKRGQCYNYPPNTDERILDVAKRCGSTALGQMFTAEQLAATAAHFGYQAALYPQATLEQLYRVLDAGHPAIVAFDVDRNGNPGDFGGDRAHYAVIEGYFDLDGERFLIAKHGWAIEKDHVWRAVDFDRSWRALRETSFYGTPGDGVIPGQPWAREPKRLALPAVGRERAAIGASLATKIIEVVPPGEAPVGGRLVAPPA